MNNLEDIILEKYVEGVIDDEHYLSLYERVVGKSVPLAVGFNIANSSIHREQLQSFKEAKTSYKENMTKAKQFIKQGKGSNAKQAIDKAIKDIENCEKIVKDADEDLLGWFVQHEAVTFKRTLVSEVIAIGMALMIGTTSLKAAARHGAKNLDFDGIPHSEEKRAAILIVGGAAGIAAIATIVKDCKNLLKYKDSAKDLGSALSRQRANMLGTLDKCKKNLKKLQSKIK